MKRTNKSLFYGLVAVAMIGSGLTLPVFAGSGNGSVFWNDCFSADSGSTTATTQTSNVKVTWTWTSQERPVVNLCTYTPLGSIEFILTDTNTGHQQIQFTNPLPPASGSTTVSYPGGYISGHVLKLQEIATYQGIFGSPDSHTINTNTFS